MPSSKLKIALGQLTVGQDKNANLETALKMIESASAEGAHIIAFPECFNSPYGIGYFAKYAEKIPGRTTDFLANAAKKHNIYIVGGSIPEYDDGKIYNTCTIWGSNGDMLAKYRKVHLADNNIAGRQRSQESAVLSPGNNIAIFDHPKCKIGVAICYDIRFSEMIRLYATKGCDLVILPHAFDVISGPAHLKLLHPARALDNQIYIAAISPARDPTADYQIWGYSSIVDPFGQVIASAKEIEEIIYAEIDVDEIKSARHRIPLKDQWRFDIYGGK